MMNLLFQPDPRAAIITFAASAALLFCGPLEAQEEPVPVEHRLAVDYSTARFDTDLDPWHLMSLEASRRSGAGTFVARGTIARRFSETGEQIEIDAYPLLGESAYAYLNAGVSSSDIFPQLRVGAELYGLVAPGLEASAGGRFLDFDVQQVMLYTASLGFYKGNYYINARPFVSPRDGELLFSGGLMVRRYMGESDEWIALVASGGEVPGEEVTAFELERVRSASALIEGRKRLGSPVGLRWTGGFEWEEISADVSRRRIVLGVGLEARL